MPDSGEQRFINHISRLNPKNLIGDDCAIWNNKSLLVTTDQMVESVHFDFEFMTPHDIGWRLMAANASDIIAMGGRPSHYLCNIAIPHDRKEQGFGIIEGMSDFARQHKITLLGGDTTTATAVFLAVTMFGNIEKSLWKRDGAQSGDSLLIADYPGLSLAGLHHLKKGDRDDFPDAVQRFLRPNPYSVLPEMCEGVTAAIDISDSLLSETKILAQQSGVTITIDIDAIPRHRDVIKTANNENISLEQLLLGSGEEFFLLATAKKPLKGWHTIGKVLPKEENNCVYLTKNGAPFSLDNITPFSHF
ncbi:thiamine-phosphate kinase [bacterium]|nr:thiamine-phosphate kinase [bacterium]